jgi:hypothetical protein
VKIQIMGRKVGLRCKGKILLGAANKFFGEKVLKNLLAAPSKVLSQNIMTKNSNFHDFF